MNGFDYEKKCLDFIERFVLKTYAKGSEKYIKMKALFEYMFYLGTLVDCDEEDQKEMIDLINKKFGFK